MNITATTAIATSQVVVPKLSEPRQPVLVLVHSDGFIEVFGGDNINVRVIDVPRVVNPQIEVLVEQYIESKLPLSYREIFSPGCRRAMHMSREVTPESIVRTRWELEMLRAIQSIGKESQRGH